MTINCPACWKPIIAKECKPPCQATLRCPDQDGCGWEGRMELTTTYESKKKERPKLTRETYDKNGGRIAL